jgi:hypothetical protein
MGHGILRSLVGEMKRGQDIAIIASIAVVAILTGLMVIRSEWRYAALGMGFLSSTLGAAGMYFRLRRELPDHPLARARYGGWDETERNRNFFALIRVHWSRHRVDIWTALLAVGILIMGAVAWVILP